MKRDLTPLPPPPPRIPLMEGRKEKIRVRGPTEAALFLLLWENMLCRLSPQRFEAKSGQEIKRRVSSEETSPVGLEAPDATWRCLFAQSAANFDFPVHAALWAPFVERDTGVLPEEGLSQHVLSVIPSFLRDQFLRDRVQTFLSQILQGRAPSREFQSPHLRLRVDPAVFTLRDPDNRIHCHDGPAVVFADGTPQYYWRGMTIPQKWLPAPSKDWLARNEGCPPLLPRVVEYEPPTPTEALTHPNLELRRCACEILGWDTVISSLHPKVLDEDPDPTIGTLVQVTLPPANSWMTRPDPQNFLRVRCGTGRSFSLAVPTTCRTAREANAWTYGLDPSDYQPEVRT